MGFNSGFKGLNNRHLSLKSTFTKVMIVMARTLVTDQKMSNSLAKTYSMDTTYIECNIKLSLTESFFLLYKPPALNRCMVRLGKNTKIQISKFLNYSNLQQCKCYIAS